MPRLLWIFLGCHFFVWVVLPFVFRTGVPMDSLEAVVWGTSWEWGTNKHPFLSAWVADLFFEVFQNPALSIYILSQVCVVTALIFIYKTACCLTDKRRALLSVLFLEGIIYYSICSVEFNVNVLSLPLVAGGTYFLYKATQTRFVFYWILTGVFAGLMMVTKYTNLFFLLGWFTYLIVSKQGRSFFKTGGLYIAGAMCGLIFLPHFLWLVQHDFYPFDYLLQRSSSDGGFFYGHFVEPIRFLGAQFVACLLSLCMIFFVFKGKVRSFFSYKSKELFFLCCVGVLPLIYFTALGFVLGNSFKSMWGFAFLGYIPLILISSCHFSMTRKLIRRGACCAFITLGILGCVFVCSMVFHVSKKAHFDGQAFSTMLHQKWEQAYHTPLSLVGGEIWYASNVAVLGKNRVPVLIDMNLKTAPWIDPSVVLNKGVLIVSSLQSDFDTYRLRYPHIQGPFKISLHLKNAVGHEKNITVFYGFLPPLNMKENA